MTGQLTVDWDALRVLAIEEVPHKTSAAEIGIHSVVRAPADASISVMPRAKCQKRPSAG